MSDGTNKPKQTSVTAEQGGPGESGVPAPAPETHKGQGRVLTLDEIGPYFAKLFAETRAAEPEEVPEKKEQKSSRRDRQSVRPATPAAAPVSAPDPLALFGAFAASAAPSPAPLATSAFLADGPKPVAELVLALSPLVMDVLQAKIDIFNPRENDPGPVKSSPMPEYIMELAPTMRVYKRYSTVAAGKKMGGRIIASFNGHTISRKQIKKLTEPNTSKKKLLNHFSERELNDLIALAGGRDLIWPLQLEVLQTLLFNVVAHLNVKSNEIFGPSIKQRYTNLKIFTVEFCSDLGPFTQDECDLAFDELCRATFHIYGKVYTERVYDKNPCMQVKVPSLDGTRFGNVEEVFIKIYRKTEDYVRIEVVIKNPRIASKTRNDILALDPRYSHLVTNLQTKNKKKKARQSYNSVEEMVGELNALAQEAEKRIKEVIEILPEIRLAKEVSPSEFKAALKTYGISAEGRGMQEFIKQICETGVYDIYSLEAKKQVRREVRKQKFAHETWGILEKVEREKKSGAGNQPFYRLRKDWRDSIKNFQPEEVSRAKPPLERTLNLTEKLELDELNELHKVIHKKLGIEDEN